MKENTIKVNQQENVKVFTVQPDREPQIRVRNTCRPAFMLMPLLMIAIWLFFVIFFVVMTYKFVRAAERIANKFEQGIVIKKNGHDI